MAYTVKHFDGIRSIKVYDQTVNADTNLQLLGKNFYGYGEIIAENFLQKGVEKILTGGVVANIFLIASGVDIGEPSTEFVERYIPDYKNVIKLAKELLKTYEGRIEIPTDVALNMDGKRYGTNVSNLPQNY